MNSRNKTGSINAFDFDLGLGSGGTKPMNNLKNQGPSYTSAAQQRSNTTSSWTQQPNKPAWAHQPVASLSGPTSMVGDISGKSWNSSPSSSSSLSGIGIVNSKNPNLFSDLLGSAMGNKSSSNVQLKNAGHNVFSMGSVADSLPKTGNLAKGGGVSGSIGVCSGGNANVGGNYGNGSSFGGGNVNVGVNSNRNSNLGGPSIKSMGGSGVGAGGMGLNKDPFSSLVDFSSKPMKPTSKESDRSGLGKNTFGVFQNAPTKPSVSAFSPGVLTFETRKTDPVADFGFANTQTGLNQPSGESNEFDVLFSSSLDGGKKGSEDFMSQKFSGGDDWGMDSEFGEADNGAGTTELEGLPPPPAGVTASSARYKGMDNYKQGQFADAIKWLSWAVILLERAGDDDGTMEVLTSRASCYKEVGEYKKAVADCTKVLEHNGTNVLVLVQRALLYESMEKYKLGAEDLRTVMKLDPGNRVARSTVHRMAKMAEQ